MHSLSDNQRGAVHVLSDWDAATGRFARVDRYLDNLRNPNSATFYTDARRFGPNAFLLPDDFSGAIYFMHKP